MGRDVVNVGVMFEKGSAFSKFETFNAVREPERAQTPTNRSTYCLYDGSNLRRLLRDFACR